MMSTPHPCRAAAPVLRQAPSCVAAAVLALVVSGCAATRNHDMPKTPSLGPVGAPAEPAARSTGQAVATAQAALVAPDGAAAGRAVLRQLTDAGGVEITLQVQGMPAGPHGFHIHAHGACAPGPDAATGRLVPFGAAGGHFDPFSTRNHGQPGQSPHEAHAGEAPNVQVGPDGLGTLRFVNPHVTLLPGATSVLGRTLVVHAQADDYASDPAGDSGGRIACGVIEPAAQGVVRARSTLDGAAVFPEGIAIDPRSGDAFVGSSSEGHLYRIRPQGRQAEIFQLGGSPGRQGAYGMKVDAHGRLWVAGGPGNTVAVVDTQRATTLAVIEGPKGGQPFLNDLALTATHAYVTDSFRPMLWRIAISPGAPAVLEPWLDLSATPARYVPNAVNWNGIVASADGRWLLAVQTSTGQLWRIDTANRAVTEVRVEGGSLLHGDGLALAGANDLYVVRNADNELARVALAPDWSSARIVQRLQDPRLKYPTTAAVAGDGTTLQVVNGQLDRQKNPPPLLPFDVLHIGLPR